MSRARFRVEMRQIRLLLGIALAGAVCATAASPSAAAAAPGRIAFTTVEICESPPPPDGGGCPVDDSIDTVRPDGRARTRLIGRPFPTDPTTGHTYPTKVRYSPDGRSLAVLDRAGRIAIASADGSGFRILPGFGCPGLAVGCLLVHDVSWSPDGTRLAVVVSRYSGNPSIAYGDEVADVYLVPLGGGAPSRLTTGAWARSLSWSSSGLIAYASRRRIDHGRIVVLDPRSGRSRVLIRGQGYPRTRRSSVVVVGNPVWTPDGRRMLFSRERDSSHRRWLLASPRGTIVRALHLGPATDPSWSPDGRQIAFSRDGALWTYGLAGGSVRRLVSAEDAVDIESLSWRPG